MIIRSVELLKILPSVENFTQQHTFPKILFFGKSNVGKSSLINSLLQNKKIARTSSKPGRTTLFYYFLINKSFLFVDAPGYGYAKVPTSLKKHWENQFHILLRQTNLKLIIHLIDLRHPPSKLDQQYHKIIQTGEVAYTIIATKSDTLSNNKRKQAVAQLGQSLQKEVFDYSIKEPKAQEHVWAGITHLLPILEK